MPIVSGNEPRRTGGKRGPNLGWIVPLLVLGPPLYNYLRSLVAGRITDQQLVIIAGGAAVLLVMAMIVTRVNRSRGSNTSSLPTPTQTPISYGDGAVPRSPRYEPMITGKAIFASVVLGALLVGLGVVLLG